MQKLTLAVVLLFSIALPVFGERKLVSKISELKIEYPQKAVSARMAGVVVVTAIVNPDGVVSDVYSKTVGGSITFLKDYALENVRKWKFEKAKQDRQETIDVTFIFRFVDSKSEEGVSFDSKSGSYGFLVSRRTPPVQFVGDKLSPTKE